MDIATIEELTLYYASARQLLTQRVQQLQDELEAVKRKHLDGIRSSVNIVAGHHDQLRAALQEAPALFAKPRTRTLHGVKVGFTKQPGKVVIDDEEAVIKRIRKLLPDAQAELLIRVRASVHKPAVYDLTAGDLKRLGITVTNDEDAVVIKPVDGEVDRLVNALLAEAERIEDAA